jgi:hypothetical protein
VNFSYVGTTTRSGYNTADGLNTISWGTLDPGVLGENHCSYYLNGPRIDSDTIISNQFSWDSDSSNGVSGYSLESVLEHELGHGLGMGHTTPGANDPGCDGTASTPVMCPAIAPGQRKTIKPDDRAGAASMYPLSGSPPAAPTNVTATQNGNAYNVSWTASTGSKNAYDVERGNSACSGAWVPAGTVAAASTSFTDDDFGAGLSGTYCYRVKAIGVGGDSGWTTQTVQGVPQTVSVSPNNATVDPDVATSFVATYRHTASYLQLKRNDLIVSTATNTGLQGCWVFYRRDLNRLYLRDDGGAYLDAGAPGTGTTVENSRCRLIASASSVSGSGTDLAVTYRLSFKPAFAGSYQLILRDEEMNTGVWSAYTDHGDLTVN